MTMRRWCLSVLLLSFGSYVASATVENKEAKQQRSTGEPSVAVVGGRVITESQLERALGGKLFRLRSEEYRLKRDALDGLITQTLLESAAAARKVSVDELTKQEVDQKILPVTDDQKRAVYEATRESYQGKPEDQALASIEANLQRIRFAEARQRYLSKLKLEAGIRVLLEPPRIDVASENSPARGPASAPVTIVEFADFQCPACARARPAVRELEQRYKSELRIVYRHLPLAMHPLAPKAAEAAACAREQGKFWEMHDRLFAAQNSLTVPDLKRHAMSIGLDGETFAGCLDTSKYAKDLQADISAAAAYGVDATPTFFVNGRMVVGGQGLAQVVEEEVVRAKANDAR